MSRVKPTLFSASDASGAVRGTWGGFISACLQIYIKKNAAFRCPFLTRSNTHRIYANSIKLNQTHAYALFRSVVIKARIHLHWISVDCEFLRPSLGSSGAQFQQPSAWQFHFAWKRHQTSVTRWFDFETNWDCCWNSTWKTNWSRNENRPPCWQIIWCLHHF